jgi:hypothetical protein
MGTHSWSTTQLRGWMMDVLVDLSFHVRALIRALFDLILFRIALRLHFLVLKPVARYRLGRGLGWVLQK